MRSRRPERWIFIAAVLIAAVPPPAMDNEEKALLASTIAELRPQIAYPPAARFRRVHFRRVVDKEGVERLTICGQVEVDDPRAYRGWTMFGAVETGDTVTVMMGPSIAAWCAADDGQWDYSRDLSEQFHKAIVP